MIWKILSGFAHLTTFGLLLLILKNQKMQTQTDEKVLAIVEEINVATNQVADRLNAVITDPNSTLSPESLDALQSAADRLKAIGSNVENPVPNDGGTGDTGDTGGGTEAGGGGIDMANPAAEA